MKKLFFVLINFVFTGNVFADLTIVQKVESSAIMGQPPRNGMMTMYIKGSKAKIENMSPGMSQIVDIDEGKIYMLNSARKTVMVMTSDDTKRVAGIMGKAGMASAAEKIGNSKTVNGYACEEYKITMSGVISSETIACISGDIDTTEIEKFRTFSEELAKQFGGLPLDVKGFPVLSDTKMKVLGKEVTSHSELVSVLKDAISDDVFAVPADYKVQEMPKLR